MTVIDGFLNWKRVQAFKTKSNGDLESPFDYIDYTSELTSSHRLTTLLNELSKYQT